jgi:hypothetical protein
MLHAIRATIFIALLFPSASNSQTVLGEGNLSCGRWTQERNFRGSGAFQLESWILGYMSGLNEKGVGQADISRGTDFFGLFGWIDRYCMTNPLDKLYMATNSLK